MWLLLHLRDWRCPFQSAREAKQALKKVMPAWCESKTTFRDFQDGVAAAIDRARRLALEGEEHRRNPASGVWRLVAGIRGEPVG